MLFILEQGTGIEPAFTAWEAVVLPIYEPCIMGYCSIPKWKIQPFCVETFSHSVALYLQDGQIYFLPLWEITKLAKNRFFTKMWLNFEALCARIYKYHYGRIAPFWQSPKQRRTEKCLILSLLPARAAWVRPPPAAC